MCIKLNHFAVHLQLTHCKSTIYQLKININKNKGYKERYYITIKGSIQGDDITLFNIHVPNIEAPKYMQQTVTDIEGKTDGNEGILKDFNNGHINGQIFETEISIQQQILNDKT